MASCHFVRVANKILIVNTLIYSYFIGSHDANASWWHFHPHADQKNASRLVFPVEILCEFEINILSLQHLMRFSGSTIELILKNGLLPFSESAVLKKNVQSSAFQDILCAFVFCPGREAEMCIVSYLFSGNYYHE